MSRFPLVTTPCDSREELVKLLCASEILPVLDHELVGNHLWVVQSHPSPHRGPVIYCHVLVQTPQRWAYRTVSEAHARSLLDCPPRLLELAPPTNPTWRLQVGLSAA